MSDYLKYEDLDEELGDIFGEEAVTTMVEEEPGTVIHVHALEIIFQYAQALCPGLEINDRGLRIPEAADFSQVENLAELFEQMSASTPLMWADTINQAEVHFRPDFTQLLSTRVGKAEGTIRNWRFVANQIPWEMRPDPRTVQMSKLYMIASLSTIAGKNMVIKLAEREAADTESVKAITTALKTYPEEEGERSEAEEWWAAHWDRHNDLTMAEMTTSIREDLHERGHLGEAEEEEKLDLEAEPKDTSGQSTAEDLVDKLLELAEEAGQNVPQNTLALFASMINASKVMIFTNDPEAASHAFQGLGMIAQHSLQLRLAQIEAGTTEVGCTCEISDMGAIDALQDCPIHGWSEEDDTEGGGDMA